MKKALIAMLLVLAMMVAASAFAADEAKKPVGNGVNLIPGGATPVAINIFTGRPFPAEGSPAFVSTPSELKGNGVNLIPGGVTPVAINIFTGRPFSMVSANEPKSQLKGNGVNLIPGGATPVAINIFTGRPF
jgi:hypothetical protein